MATRSVELAVRMTADVDKVASSFDSVGDSALRMSDDVDRASRVADDSTSRLGSAATAADDLGSKSSQAAGGIGDLGGALSLLPGPLGALGTGMEIAAPAIQGVTGAADLFSLAAQRSTIVTKISTGVTKVWTGVTKGAAVAMKLLNAVMRANPLGLAIVAATALVGLFVLLYKRSETFRNFVGKLKDTAISAFKAILGPVQAVVDAVKNVVGWVDDAISATKRAIGLGKDYKSLMGDTINDVLAGLDQVGQQVGNQVRGATNTVTPSEAGRDRTTGSDPVPPVQITVQGALDPNAVAKQIGDLLARYGRRTVVQVTP